MIRGGVMVDHCILCMLPRNRRGDILQENDFAYVAAPDGGDLKTSRVIALRQHVLTFSLVSPAEWTGLMRLVDGVRAELQAANGGGCTLYWSGGSAAGQTSDHLHLQAVSRPDNTLTAGMDVAALLRLCGKLDEDRRSLEDLACRD